LGTKKDQLVIFKLSDFDDVNNTPHDLLIFHTTIPPNQ
jgi:hypothetical protein